MLASSDVPFPPMLRGAGSITTTAERAALAAESEASAAGRVAAARVAQPGEADFVGPMPNFDRIGAEGGVLFSSLRTGQYGILKDELRGTGLQANHLNQNAAYKSIIPSDEGVAVGMRGNAFTEIGSPHYEFHSSLESFWQPYRKGGELFGSYPTNAQYSEALNSALRSAGLSEIEVSRLSELAAQNRAAYGLLESQPVPRIPGRLAQTKQ